MNAEQIRAIILRFEQGEISADDAALAVNSLAARKTDAWELEHSEYPIEEFIRDLVTPEIAEWRDITEETAHKMLARVFSEIDDHVYAYRATQALERRYGKEEGAVFGWIYSEDKSEDEIIELLKKDTRIYL